jgi:hypothetical protein
MKNYIENQHKRQKLTNIKVAQRTITDKTTTPTQFYLIKLISQSRLATLRAPTQQQKTNP